MEVKKIKVIKEVEVEEEMFCFTREETELIFAVYGALVDREIERTISKTEHEILFQLLHEVRKTIACRVY